MKTLKNKTIKIFTAGFMTESNSFSPFPATFQDFENYYIKRGGNHDNPPNYFAQPLIVFAKLAKELGWQYIESLCTAAAPKGRIIKKIYETYRNEILDDLKKAMPVDIVLLGLHGAMMADGYDDCEGDLLHFIREIVGPDALIGAVFDPHTNLTDLMLNNATALIWMKEYPHTDFKERAADLFQIIKDTMLEKIKPHMTVYDCHMINMYPTTIEPMRNYIQEIKNLEKSDVDILSISVVHGFPWGDMKDVGTKIVVITNDQPKKSKQLAKMLGDKLHALRGKTLPKLYTIDEALDVAIDAKNFPVVLADFSDNVGGGAAGDSTFILQRILQRNIKNVAIGIIWDPIATEIATSVGEGANLSLRIGGKMSPLSGNPLDLKVTVKKIIPNLVTKSLGDAVVSYGTAATVTTENNVDIIIATKRLQTYSTECFSKMEIDPAQKEILVVKSSEHFRASFKKISSTILTVAAPGTICPKFDQIKYTKLQRKLWPFN